jgi:hypothetical protein
MDIIEKFIRENCWRFPKGYPDINNLEDTKLLFELLKKEQLQEEEGEINYDEEIKKQLALVQDPENKRKLLKYMNALNVGEDKDDDKLEESIKVQLENRNIPKAYVDFIVLLAFKLKELSKLDAYLKNPTISYEDLETNSSLLTLTDPVPLSEAFKNRIIDLEGGRGVGKGEVAIVLFLRDAKIIGGRKDSDDAKGDVEIQGHAVEIKADKAQLVSFDIASYGSKPTAELKRIFGEDLEITSGTLWPNSVEQYYKNSEDKEEVLNLINKTIKTFYGGHSHVKAIKDSDLEQPSSLLTYLTDQLAISYLKGKNVLMLNTKTDNYILIESEEDYMTNRASGAIKILSFSDKFPRLTYNK